MTPPFQFFIDNTASYRRFYLECDGCHETSIGYPFLVPTLEVPTSNASARCALAFNPPPHGWTIDVDHHTGFTYITCGKCRN